MTAGAIVGSFFAIGPGLVVIWGAEPFTGSSLLVQAALHGRIGQEMLAENWLGGAGRQPRR